MTTFAQALKTAQQQLVNSETSRLDSEVLLALVLDCNRSYLFTWPDKTLTPAQEKHFEKIIMRRAFGEPVAYIAGKQEFWSLTLQVDASTLIPRPETELLVELALQKLPATHCKVIDLGTGTGAIALALAKERPQWQVMACDASSDAVTLAKRNAQNLQINNVSVFESNWFDNVDEQVFDLIISNPPYIDEADIHLAQGDVRFEPRSALVAGNHGLADIEKISQQARLHLKSGGHLMLEHGFSQGEQVRGILNRDGYSNVETFRDIANQERVTIGRFLKGEKQHG